MIVDSLTLAAGLALLLSGGHGLVRGASSLARALGISSLTIGLTVVALGTSAPELATNITAAWSGNGEISFGNIVGSNMANIGLILGISVLIRPVVVRQMMITREIPMMLLATVAAAILAFDHFLEGRTNEYGRADGLILLLIFSVFLYYTWGDIRSQQKQADEAADPPRAARTARSLALVGVGLAALVIGAEWTVQGAVSLAQQLGISEAVIGLTLIAVGTSLPELATSLVAVARRETDVAIGNVVGSNIFNLLLVGGLTATTHPIPIPPGGYLDLLFLCLLSGFLLAFAISQNRTILRAEGVLLLGLYLGYISFRMLG